MHSRVKYRKNVKEHTIHILFFWYIHTFFYIYTYGTLLNNYKPIFQAIPLTLSSVSELIFRANVCNSWARYKPSLQTQLDYTAGVLSSPHWHVIFSFILLNRNMCIIVDVTTKACRLAGFCPCLSSLVEKADVITCPSDSVVLCSLAVLNMFARFIVITISLTFHFCTVYYFIKKKKSTT